MGEAGECIRMQREAIDARRAEADDGIGQVVETLLQRAALGVRLVLREPVHARSGEQLDACVGSVCEQRALDAVVARPDHRDALAGQVTVFAALEHDANARIVGGCECRGYARERRHTEREYGVLGLNLVAGRRRHPHAAVGELDARDVARIELRHERAPEPVRVAQEVLQRKRLDALALSTARPRIERAGAAGGREAGGPPAGAKPHVGRHQRAPGAHGLAVGPGAAAARGRGDRQPEGPRADDCGVDAIHVSQPSG